MIFSFLSICWTLTTGRPVADSLTKEAFVDSVCHTIVDSSWTHYLLVATAHPSSMVRYDYDEWVKYGLLEDVPFGVLNELAKKALAHREPQQWQEKTLIRAHCIPADRSDSVLGAIWLPDAGSGDPHPLSKEQKRQLRRWKHLPAADRTVFNFSYPLFTDDGEYALIDLDKHCDPRQCGLGLTCLFRRTDHGWKLAGRMVRWGG